MNSVTCMRIGINLTFKASLTTTGYESVSRVMNVTISAY